MHEQNLHSQIVYYKVNQHEITQNATILTVCAACQSRVARKVEKQHHTAMKDNEEACHAETLLTIARDALCSTFCRLTFLKTCFSEEKSGQTYPVV
jgi:hypothetical protein